MAQARAGRVAGVDEAAQQELVRQAYEAGRIAGIDEGRQQAQDELAALGDRGEDVPVEESEMYRMGYEAGHAAALKVSLPLFEAGRKLVDDMKATASADAIKQALLDLEDERGERFVQSDIRLLLGSASRFQQLRDQREAPAAQKLVRAGTEYEVAT